MIIVLIQKWHEHLLTATIGTRLFGLVTVYCTALQLLVCNGVYDTSLVTRSLLRGRGLVTRLVMLAHISSFSTKPRPIPR